MTSISSIPGITTQRYDIAAFVVDIEEVIAHQTDPHIVTVEVERHLIQLLQTPELLTTEQRKPDPQQYCPHIITVAPSGHFTVVALVWLPGQQTAIHDHIAWCVVGVLEGIESETRYTLRTNDTGDRWLYPGDSEMMTTGMVARLVPPEENIHYVRNAGTETAISLHIYGANLQSVASHSSINECFDHLPIREDSSGVALPWRKNSVGTDCDELL